MTWCENFCLPVLSVSAAPSAVLERPLSMPLAELEKHGEVTHYSALKQVSQISRVSCIPHIAFQNAILRCLVPHFKLRFNTFGYCHGQRVCWKVCSFKYKRISQCHFRKEPTAFENAILRFLVPHFQMRLNYISFLPSTTCLLKGTFLKY